MADQDTDGTVLLRERIDAATEHVEEAERDLRDVLRVLEQSARAEKVMVGETLRTALDQLAETRKRLAAARKTEV